MNMPENIWRQGIKTDSYWILARNKDNWLISLSIVKLQGQLIMLTRRKKMLKKVSILILIAILLLFAACSKDSTVSKPGIEINAISTSIGAVGTNTNDIEIQSFKFTITMTSNEAADISIVSVKPVLSEKFLERASNGDVAIQVNKVITKGSSLNVSGEIIFDAKGLTKEQIISMEPFVKEVKIIEERIINKSF